MSGDESSFEISEQDALGAMIVLAGFLVDLEKALISVETQLEEVSESLPRYVSEGRSVPLELTRQVALLSGARDILVSQRDGLDGGLARFSVEKEKLITWFQSLGEVSEESGVSGDPLSGEEFDAESSSR